jgi:hypothetical protein
MDFGKLGHLMIAGGFHGLCWAFLEPASTAPDWVAMAVYAALLLSGIYVLGVFLAPSPDAETLIRTKDPGQPFE